MANGVDLVSESPLIWVPLLGLLVTAVAWDLRLRRVPNAIPLGLALAGLAANLWLRPLGIALLISGGGLLIGFLLWLPPVVLRLAGGADLKLAAGVGVWLGPLGALRVSIYAALASGLMALIWLWWNHGLLGSWVFLKALPGRVSARDVAGAELRSVSSLPFATALAAATALELFGPALLLGGAS